MGRIIDLPSILIEHAAPNVDLVDGEGKTALMLAIIEQDKEMVEYLLHIGVNVFIQDSDGSTVLHYAALFGDAEIIQLLLANHVDPTLVNSLGYTALDVAEENENFNAVEILNGVVRDARPKKAKKRRVETGKVEDELKRSDWDDEDGEPARAGATHILR